MKFNKLHNPAACIADEQTRYAISGVALLKIEGRPVLASTDGRSAVLVPAEMDEGEESAIGNIYPGAAFDAARKNASRSAADAKLSVNGVARLEKADCAIEWKQVEGRFPDIAAIERDVLRDTKTVTVTINADYLETVQRAMGGAAVELRISLEEDGSACSAIPIRVLPVNGTVGPADGVRAYVMPMSGS